ncbi:hypothetical protein GPECTOR_113g288 [Gonium pectorale]|uniref:Formin-like protein n=1 Tax=Gonium pectorale TaxID=33097 RepID=A0A150FZ29_GONPE|nr:hypothetical protein GPECTOR_113g288 [Gonium pectorale]|eukprot:KXZ42876.1 hypothetical protein GPECTOR_113g288 [Gonium pectorale]
MTLAQMLRARTCTDGGSEEEEEEESPLLGSGGLASRTAALGRQGPQPKPVPQPSKKLKTIFWDSIPALRLHSTFWVEPDEDEQRGQPAAEGEGEGEGGAGESGGEGPTTLDWSLMEEMFAVVAKQPRATASKTPAKQAQQSVIDSKKSYNINILMGSKIKMPVDVLRARVVQLDPRVFDEDVLEALGKCVPDAEDQAALAAYRDSGKPVEELADAERVCLQLMSIPNADQRLKVYGYKFKLPSLIDKARQAYAANLRAIEAMRTSPMFRRALRLAVSAGNFLNYGTRMGNAVGFRLRVLPKLADTKSADNKHSLLSMLALEVMRIGERYGESPDVVLSDQMAALADPKLKTSHQESGDTLNSVEQQLNEMRDFLSTYVPITDVPDVVDRFADTMREELETLERQAAEVKELQARVKVEYEAMLKYFGENLNSTPSDTEFWDAISQFVDKFSATQKALVTERKEKEEREARRRQREAAEAEKARKASLRRQETADARERLLSGGRTPAKQQLQHQQQHLTGAGPAPATNAFAAAAAAVHQPSMSLPGTPTVTRAFADSAGGAFLTTPPTFAAEPPTNGSAGGALALAHLTPTFDLPPSTDGGAATAATAAAAPSTSRPAFTLLQRRASRDGGGLFGVDGGGLDGGYLASPGPSPMAHSLSLSSSSFAARLSEAGFSLHTGTAGSGAGAASGGGAGTAPSSPDLGAVLKAKRQQLGSHLAPHPHPHLHPPGPHPHPSPHPQPQHGPVPQHPASHTQGSNLMPHISAPLPGQQHPGGQGQGQGPHAGGLLDAADASSSTAAGDPSGAAGANPPPQPPSAQLSLPPHPAGASLGAGAAPDAPAAAGAGPALPGGESPDRGRAGSLASWLDARSGSALSGEQWDIYLAVEDVMNDMLDTLAYGPV